MWRGWRNRTTCTLVACLTGPKTDLVLRPRLVPGSCHPSSSSRPLLPTSTLQPPSLDTSTSESTSESVRSPSSTEARTDEDRDPRTTATPLVPSSETSASLSRRLVSLSSTPTVVDRSRRTVFETWTELPLPSGRLSPPPPRVCPRNFSLNYLAQG